MQQPLRIGSLAIAALVMVAPPRSFAQSGGEFSAHQRWCASIGGTHNNDPNNPTCTPGSGGGSSGGGYSTREQAALDLAGAFGSALGNAIRESMEAAARQAEMNRLQRSWEMEQERIRLEEERVQAQAERERKHRELMSKLKGSLGQTELKMRGIGSESLQLKSGDALFGQSNPTGTLEQEVPVAAGIPNQPAPATVEGKPVTPGLVQATEKAWDDYLAAVQRKNHAEARLKQAEAEQRMIEQLRREAEKKRQEQHLRTAAIPPDRPEEKKIEDDKLAQAEKLLQEATQLDEDATKELVSAKKDAEGARAALAEAEKEKQLAMKSEQK